MTTSHLNELRAAVIDFQEEEVERLTRQALAAGAAPNDIMTQGLVPALAEVGRRYSTCEYFLPELVMCGSAVKAAMAILDPILESGGTSKRPGRVVIGTVAGDLHDIGKNMVISMLKGSGYAILDLGVDVPAERFTQAVREQRPDVLGLSALLLTTREEMRTVIGALDAAGLRDKVKIMVGGCAVDQKFADEIGADGFGPDAPSAVALARRLVPHEEVSA